MQPPTSYRNNWSIVLEVGFVPEGLIFHSSLDILQVEDLISGHETLKKQENPIQEPYFSTLVEELVFFGNRSY